MFAGALIMSLENGTEISRLDTFPNNEKGSIIPNRAFWLELAGNQLAVLNVKNPNKETSTVAVYNDGKGIGILQEIGINQTTQLGFMYEEDLYRIDCIDSNNDYSASVSVAPSKKPHGAGCSNFALHGLTMIDNQIHK